MHDGSRLTYTPLTFERTQEGTDQVNLDYFLSLTEEQKVTYSSDRWGPDRNEATGCEREARDRSHPINVMSEEYSALLERIANDERHSATYARYFECVGDVAAPTPEIARDCAQSAGVDASLDRQIIEEHETEFILENHTRLAELKENRP